MKRQLVDPHKAERKQREYEFAYTTCVQNLETALENLDGLRDTARYLFEQSPADHSSTPSGNRKSDSTGSKTFFALASELQPFGNATHPSARLYHHLGLARSD